MQDRNNANKKVIHWGMVGIVFVFFSMLVVGLQRDLPYVPDIDEPNYVTRAVKMASSGDLNPHRFAHPASTTYYPLTAIYHVWNALTHHGMLFHFDSNLQQTFSRNSWEFYILGRFLSIIYAVLSIPLIYLLGESVFNSGTGVVGTLFFSCYSLILFYGRIVRTDSAALFWGLMSLWLVVRIYKKPTTLNQLLVGLAIGLSISSRYFMAILILVLVVIDTALLWQTVTTKKRTKLLWAQIIIGLNAVGVGFILSTPFLFGNFNIFLHDIAFESRNTNPGFDGLSPIGNFWWYITHAIPTIMSWPQVFFMIVGIGYSIWKKYFLPILLLGFSLIFIVFVSQFSLHWPRWIIQILPILSLFAAYGVNVIVIKALKNSQITVSNPKLQQILIFVVVALLLVIPIQKDIRLDLKAANYSTRIIALKWIQNNMPINSRIAFGEYSAPLENTKFETFKSWSLAQAGYTLDDYREKYDYIVVSNSIYDRFFNEPERYPTEIQFYKQLFNNEKLIFKIEPSLHLGGGTIQVYELNQPKNE